MAEELRLVCLVAGEPSSNALPVKDSSTLIVDELKDLIKTKKAPEFDDIAADKLTLLRVSIPVVSADKHIAIILSEIESKTEPVPTDDLFEAFEGQPPKKTIHIIVQRPPPIQTLRNPHR
ncbi:hypothetical protein BGZ74_008044 [Mortierella antarctica]|nr:hypothetical protein BGZ74_008044 [Mortierella antarctica]